MIFINFDIMQFISAIRTRVVITSKDNITISVVIYVKNADILWPIICYNRFHSYKVLCEINQCRIVNGKSVNNNQFQIPVILQVEKCDSFHKFIL